MNKYAKLYIEEFEKKANPLLIFARSFGQGLKYLPRAMSTQYSAAGGNTINKVLNLLKTYGFDLPKKNITKAFYSGKDAINNDLAKRLATLNARATRGMPGPAGERSLVLVTNPKPIKDPVNVATRAGTAAAEMTPAALAAAGLTGAGVAGYNALKPKPEPPGFFESIWNQLQGNRKR